MIKGTTKTGFKFEMDEITFDNVELFDALVEMEDGNVLMTLPKITTMLLGPEQKKKLYDHLRKDGRVSMTDLSSEIVDIFNSTKNGKN